MSAALFLLLAACLDQESLWRLPLYGAGAVAAVHGAVCARRRRLRPRRCHVLKRAGTSLARGAAAGRVAVPVLPAPHGLVLACRSRTRHSPVSVTS